MSDCLPFFLKHHVHSGLRKETGNTTISKSTTIFVGNESADSDSVIATLCYAYHCFQEDRRGIGSCNRLFIPVVSVPRIELKLRPHVAVLLQKVGLELDDLVCIDNQSLRKHVQHITNTIGIVLMAHNALSPMVAALFPDLRRTSIREIIDHHRDANKHTECSGDARNIVLGIASTCTLVFEKFCPFTSDKSVAENGNSSVEINPEVATLLLGVIALDTFNVSERANKTTERDRRAIEMLQRVSSHTADSLFAEQHSAKHDPYFWHRLSATECLKFDHKSYRVSNNHNEQEWCYGIAAVHVSAMSFLFSRCDVIDACDNYLHGQTCMENNISTMKHDTANYNQDDNNDSSNYNNNINNHNHSGAMCSSGKVDALIVMCNVTLPIIYRNLIILTASADHLADLALYVQLSDRTIDLQLSPINLSDTERVRQLQQRGVFAAVFRQGNTLMGRKILEPLLSDFYAQTHFRYESASVSNNPTTYGNQQPESLSGRQSSGGYVSDTSSAVQSCGDGSGGDSVSGTCGDVVGSCNTGNNNADNSNGSTPKTSIRATTATATDTAGASTAMKEKSNNNRNNNNSSSSGCFQTLYTPHNKESSEDRDGSEGSGANSSSHQRLYCGMSDSYARHMNSGIDGVAPVAESHTSGGVAQPHVFSDRGNVLDNDEFSHQPLGDE